MTNAKRAALAEVKADMVSAQVTPLLAEQAKNLVMGTGNADAEVMLIGEAPGKKEDEQGVPFIGAAGMFLDTMLAAAGMQRSEIYITNIVKYRPPNNRDPSVEEKRAFRPYLAREIEIVDPSIIVTLGRHSMEFFLPNVTIGEVHGRVFTIQVGYDTLSERARQIVPLYHPAAALYNGSLRQTLIDDFLRVADTVTSARAT